MLMYNWYMINIFVLNLVTAMFFWKLTYCIEFAKKKISLTSGYFLFIISEQCCCFGSLCDSGSTHYNCLSRTRVAWV